MHHHGGLGLLTPYDVHFGVAAKRHAEQEAVLRKTFETMPERFVRGVTNLPALPAEGLPAEVLINNLGKNTMATRVAGYGNRSRRRGIY